MNQDLKNLSPVAVSWLVCALQTQLDILKAAPEDQSVGITETEQLLDQVSELDRNNHPETE